MGGNDKFEPAAATEWLEAAGLVAAVAVVVGVDSCRNTIKKDRSSSDVCKNSGIVYICVWI